MPTRAFTIGLDMPASPLPAGTQPCYARGKASAVQAARGDSEGRVRAPQAFSR